MTEVPVLILGARSDIAKAVARKFAMLGHPIQLAVRRADSMVDDQADLRLRYGVPVTLHEFDALSPETHEGFVNMLPELPMIAVSAIGLLGDQPESEQNIHAALTVMRSNYEGPASIMGTLANRFADRGSGTLVGISSVAGLRGRASNYAYGSAKAGFTTFLSGLRNRLAPHGVHVVTILPGFVNTQMTEGMNLPPLLTAQPKEVAEAIYAAIRKQRNVIYVRPIWRLVMTVIKIIPEGVFKKMKI